MDARGYSSMIRDSVLIERVRSHALSLYMKSMAEGTKKRYAGRRRGRCARVVWAHRKRLVLARCDLVNQLWAVLPASPIPEDEVIVKGRPTCSGRSPGGVRGDFVQAPSSASRIIGSRRNAPSRDAQAVHAQIARLPVSYFDSTQTGKLISRIMNDAEGIRNLVGTGLVQLAGSFITAIVALCVLFWLNWRLTSITILVLGVFGGALFFAFTRLRPLFRERGEIMAQLTGRLAESLGGIRIVKAYTPEARGIDLCTRTQKLVRISPIMTACRPRRLVPLCSLASSVGDDLSRLSLSSAR